MASLDKEVLTFDEFRDLMMPPGTSLAERMKGMTSLGDAFGGLLGGGDLTDEKLDEIFRMIDSDGSGSLDKQEIATAMSHLGKSDEEVRKVVGGMTKEQINFDEFKEMLVPPSMLSKMKGMKLFSNAFGGMLGGDLSDAKLREAFDRIDNDGSGTLEKGELIWALRELNKNDTQISELLGSIEKESLSFADFAELVRPPPSQLSVMRGALVGVLGSGRVDDQQLMAAFNKLDMNSDGILSKNELSHALREMGKSNEPKLYRP